MAEDIRKGNIRDDRVSAVVTEEEHSPPASEPHANLPVSPSVGRSGESRGAPLLESRPAVRASLQ